MHACLQNPVGGGATVRLPAPPARVHMVGAGGIGMAGLARLLAGRGWRVDGCDQDATGRNADWLRRGGVAVVAGHDPAHVHAGIDLVVVSSALDPEAPELIRARRLGIPLLARGTVLAALAGENSALAVSGTHGKTTTAGALTRLARSLKMDFGWCLGGWVRGLDGPSGEGGNGNLVCEVDESDGTLAGFRARVLVVTNIEPDHLENFQDFEALRRCFARAVESAAGVVYCADDPEAASVCGAHPKSLGYGIGPRARLRARPARGGAAENGFEVYYGDRRLGEVRLRVPGRHNLLNALAALGGAILAGGPPEEACARLSEAFALPERRFDLRAERDGVRVISDYAHHPTEVRALMSMLPGPGRTRVIFQPHRYSRTRAMAAGFSEALKTADEVWIVPVYAASQRPLSGGRSCDLYAACRRDFGGGRLRYADSLEEAWEGIRFDLRAGDTVLAVGAGDVDRVADAAAAFVRRGGARRSGDAPGFRRIREALESAGWRGRIEGGAELGQTTPLGVGGRGEALAFPADLSDLRRVLTAARENGFPVRILGAGSNVLVSDAGVDGVVVRLSGKAWKTFRVAGERVWAGAGMPGAALLERLAENGLSGLEFMAGIPGTVGGWLAMNAGAHGRAIASAVEEIHGLNPDGEVSIITASEAGWNYRDCEGLHRRVALGAWFRLTAEPPSRIRDRIETCRARRLDFGGLRTAGSVFRNPPDVSAGVLLDRCGCRGWRVGGARVYDRHANVIHAERGAVASDVRALIERMRFRVLDETGIELFSEIQRIGVGIQGRDCGEIVPEWVEKDAEKI